MVKGNVMVKHSQKHTQRQPLAPRSATSSSHHTKPILQRESRCSISAAVCCQLISVTVEPGQRFITFLVSHSVCLIYAQVCSLKSSDSTVMTFTKPSCALPGLLSSLSQTVTVLMKEVWWSSVRPVGSPVINFGVLISVSASGQNAGRFLCVFNGEVLFIIQISPD